MQKQGEFILFTRDEFKLWLFATKFSRTIKLVQNHHTYIPAYKHFKGNNHFNMINGMKNSHVARGFDTIAQNLTTFPDGKIAVCRNFNSMPAGIRGANTYGLCIEHVGHFDDGADIMTPQHRETIIFLNAVLCMRFGLTPNENTIVYHHWYDLSTGKRRNGLGQTKSCPGTNFFGGNKVEDAKRNFIPLIASKIDEIKNPQPVVTEIKKQEIKEVVVKMLTSKHFKDIPENMAWVKDAADRCYERGIIAGDGKGNLNPDKNMTRGELAVVADRIVEYLLKELGGK